MTHSIPHPALTVESDLPLPAVPPVVLGVLARWLPAWLSWFSQLVYALTLPRCRHHPLLRLAAGYDPTEAVSACAAYRHAAGPGAPPTYALSVLVRARSCGGGWAGDPTGRWSWRSPAIWWCAPSWGWRAG